RPILTRRPREATRHDRRDDECERANGRADGDRPQRRHGGEDHLVDGPGEAPCEDDGGEQEETDPVRRRGRRGGQDAQGFGSAARAASASPSTHPAATGPPTGAAPSALSMPKPPALGTAPPSALPTAPMRPMTRSARPWIEARSCGDSASVSSALAETNARFQPTPLRKSPAMTTPLARPGARPASASAPSSTMPPDPGIASRPTPSACP